MKISIAPLYGAINTFIAQYPNKYLRKSNRLTEGCAPHQGPRRQKIYALNFVFLNDSGTNGQV